jgi:hypothetical protein
MHDMNSDSNRYVNEDPADSAALARLMALGLIDEIDIDGKTAYRISQGISNANRLAGTPPKDCHVKHDFAGTCGDN